MGPIEFKVMDAILVFNTSVEKKDDNNNFDKPDLIDTGRWQLELDI